MKTDKLYTLKDFRFSYSPGQGSVLDIPALEIREGVCLAFAGPNGSGKTSLLKLLNDLVPLGIDLGQAQGDISFRGEAYISKGIRLGSQALRKSSIYLHQHPYIISGGFKGNMGFAVQARRLPRRERGPRIAEALGLLGLEEVSRRRHKGLSGGEAQRLALARVIASHAEILLLDEPTASVDAESRDRILAALATLSQSGTTVIFSSHEPALIDSLAQRVILFDRGGIASDIEGNHEK